MDEAGRGPWAGPVVAAAVILNRSGVPARVHDSKLLTVGQRETAYHAIFACADVGIGIVPAQEIDRRNIHQATLAAMRLAIEDLPNAPDYVLIDGLHAPTVAPPCRTIVRGDQRSYVVACASIIAKVTRDRLMRFYHELLPDYEFHAHKGYGTPAHAATLERHGPSILHRLSFQPVRDALAAV